MRFSEAFLELKRAEKALRPIVKVNRRESCGRCGSAIKRKKTGERKRMSFFCPHCQVMY